MMHDRPFILIVEDNDGDVFLIRRALAAAGVEADIKTLNDGQDAIAFCEKADTDDRAPAPDVVLLDVNLPRATGREVLSRLKGSQRCAQARVIVVTTSMAPADRDYFFRGGADEYFTKPSELDEFLKLGPLVKQFL